MRTSAALQGKLDHSPTPCSLDNRLDMALSRLKEFIKDHRKRMPIPGGDAEEFEKELHQRVLEIQREVMSDEMARADIDVEAIIVERTVYRRVLRCEETYMSDAGETSVMRTLYKDHTDEGSRAICPMELRMGITAGFFTPLAAKKAAWVVAQMTPKLAEELFERMGNMAPSKSTLDRLPKALNERWEEDRTGYEQALRDAMVVPDKAVSAAVSLDGVLVPMKDAGRVEKRESAAADGKLTKGPAGYREVGCATVSFYDRDGEMLSAVRMARMPESRKVTLKRSLAAEVLGVLAQRPDLKLVKVADAASDNWTFLAEQIPDGPELVDFYHAAEHLSDGVAAAYGDGTVEARQRFNDLRHKLLENPNGVEQVIHALAYLHRKHLRSERIATVLKFFRKNRKRMRYAEMKAQNLPVGSGVVEAACKTLVAQRLKLSGMQWGMEGGQAVLLLRGWAQSERFDRAWAMLAATYRAEVTLLNNVIPFYRK